VRARHGEVWQESLACEPLEDWLRLGIGRLVDLIDDAVVVAEPLTGQIVRWSGGAEALLGYTADQACQQSITTMIPGLCASSLWSAVDRPHPRPAPGAATDFAAYHQDGRELRVSVTLSPIQAESHGRTLALVILRDLTERLRVLSALDARNRELTALNRIADIALGSDSLESAYQQIVREISVTTGFPIVVIEHYDHARQVMIFAGATGIPSPPGGSVLEVPLAQTMSGEVVRTGQPLVETRAWDRADYADELLRQLGVHTFLCVPMIVGSRTIGALSLAHPDAVADVHELLPWVRSLAEFVASLIARKRAEEERLQLLHEQSARAQAEVAVRARDEFLQIAAHELKTPVSALRAQTQVLARRVERSQADRQQVSQGLAVINQQTEKLSRLVVQLLDVSRIDDGKLVIDPRPCDLAACVRSVVCATQVVTDRHNLVVRAPAQAMAVVDDLRIEQVLANLLNNAIRYSPDGGQIEVDMGDAPGDRIYIAVRDHGIGIPAEHRERIFDRFYQAHAGRLGGMGLGLFISAEIVRQHGGELSMDAPSDGGARFTMVLPRAPHSVAAEW
jgi:PAS domain S-box-containing protein